MKIEIRNGRLIDPANKIDAMRDLYLADGKVAAIGAAPSGFQPDQTIDASGLIVAPGLVDLSARLREPGYEYKATLESELQAAMQGGVTSLVCPPDTEPVLDEPGLVEMLRHRARTMNQAHVYPLGALTVGLKGEALTEMAELTDAGCVGFSQAEVPILDTTVLLRAMQYAQTFGYTVWLRPQDAHVGRGGVAHTGRSRRGSGSPACRSSAETIALAHDHSRSSAPRARTCPPVPLSSADGVAMVRAAKRKGCGHCDVGVHHLHHATSTSAGSTRNARL